MMKKTRVLSVIPEKDIETMDKEIENGMYSSRSHFIRRAVRKLVLEIEKK